MQLTKLRLSGFKSFVEPTELLFEPGLTGIIGPNGCGKSNLVDALKWVMGETSAKQMRGGEMDDVIFNGTQTRPARNFAEVVLHLDNHLRKAPANFNDADQLEISRRIDRGEGSSYKVNARDVRQRDVQTLFADASTGAHSTAIVSQGRIGHLVNAKPTERRVLLEEAAGIVGLHARRHEAELRLNAAENNIKRSEDVLRQLGEQLASLKKQAKQAAAYKTIAERFRATEALFFYHQWQDVLSRLRAAGTRRTELDAELQELEGQLTHISAQQTELSAHIPSLRQKQAERAAALQRLKLAEAELSGEESRLQAAQIAVEQRIVQIEGDLKRESERAVDAASAIDAISTEQTENLSAQRQSAEKLNDLEETYRIKDQLLKDAEELLQTLSDKINREESRWSGLSERQKQMRARLSVVEAELDAALAARNALSGRLSSDQSLQMRLQEVVFAEAEIGNARIKLANAETALASAQEKSEAAQKAAQEFHSAAAKLQAEADGLSAILSSTEEIRDPVMNHIRVDSGFEAALSAALGNDLFAGLEDSADRFWKSLPNVESWPSLPGDATPLLQAIAAPAELRRALALVGVVDDFATGQALQVGLQIGQCLVSKQGDLWRFDGYTARGTASQNTAAYLRHKNRLDIVRGELNAHLSGQAAIAASLENAQSDLAAEKLHEQAARKVLDAAYNALQAARNRQSDDAQRLAITQAEHQAASHQCEKLALEKTQLADDLNALGMEMGTPPDFDALRATMAGQRLGVEELRHIAFQARSAFDAANAESKLRASRFDQLDGQLRDWKKRLLEFQSQQTSLSERLQQAVAERAALSEKPAALASQREKLLTAIAEAESHRQNAADVLADAEKTLSDIDRAARQHQSEISNRREERVRHITAIELGESERQKLSFDIEERLATPPDQLLELSGYDPADLPDFDATQNRLERLRRERDNMGPVNLRADIEAAEIAGKLEQQQSDHDELIAATAKLRQGINELNKEGRERLRDAFTKVNENFSRLFTELFGGGRAYLEWTDGDDPLEAGLEIFASPPGKKLQSLSLLSGGERALTAIALLFAVFECNPAPICVLDEVDAPLDESNVDRFCNMLQAMGKRGGTRYLVITHHRLTMARMDRLFGVTMGEAGVSQLVSVDLAQAEKLRETA